MIFETSAPLLDFLIVGAVVVLLTVVLGFRIYGVARRKDDE